MNLKSLVPRRGGQTPEVARDDFFDPFVTFRREVDRMFDDFFDGWHPFTANPGRLTPPVDVEETDKELVVTAELPGLGEKDVQVDLAGDVLTIRGEKKMERESGNGYRKERRYGAFQRSIRLPFEVKDGDVDAKFRDGVLSVRLSKPADLQRPIRRIDVKAS